MRVGGCKPSAKHKIAATKPASEHPAIAAALTHDLAASFDLTLCEPARLDQNETSTCFAAAVVAAVFVAFAVHLTPLPWVPSPRDLAAVTRAMARARAVPEGAKLPPLFDEGAELADVMPALARYGVTGMHATAPDGSNYDAWPQNVNDEPDLRALEAAGRKLVAGEHTIDPSAPDLSDLVASAIVGTLAPVALGTFVDSVFMGLPPGDVCPPANTNDPKGGGHALYIVGYRTNAAGRREFLVTNSWGPDWCDAGRCWVSEAWLSACWELWVMSVREVA